MSEHCTEEADWSSWRRSVLEEAGRSWNELRFLAADRQKWKELVKNGNSLLLLLLLLLYQQRNTLCFRL
jgi:hypothetical protein